MARYFFDTHDGDLIRDDVGLECADFAAILKQATAGLADFAKDAVPGAKWREMAVKVRDEQGGPVMQAVLRLEIKR